MDSDSKILRYQVMRFDSRFSTSTMSYLASVTNPASGGPRHKHCSTEKCLASNSESAGYTLQHTRVCSPDRCAQVGFDSHEVAEIIKAGGTPLVSLITTAHDKPDFKLVTAKPSDEYFIISHVWADGLGNPNHNKLPICQCHRLQNLLGNLRKHAYDITVRDSHKWTSCTEYNERVPLHKRSTMEILRGSPMWHLRKALLLKHYFQPWKPKDSRYKQAPSLFWMDTFCVPIGYPDERQRAIDDMARIFAKAEMMLVLANEADFGPRHHRVTMGARLACSSWMARSWTCQEAALAPDWHTEQARDVGLELSKPIIQASMFGDLAKCEPENMKTDVFSKNWIVLEEIISFYVDLSQYLVDKKSEQTLKRNIRDETSLANIWRALKHFSFSRILNPSGVPEGEDTDAMWTFTGAWNSLVGRTTTQPADLDAILAIRLGFVPSALSEIPEPRMWRMKSLLKSCGQLPLALLYSTGDKLPDVSSMDRWIPAYPGREILNPRHGYMKVTPKGLDISPPQGPHGSVLCYGLPVYTRAVLIPMTLKADNLCVRIPNLRITLWVSLISPPAEPENRRAPQSSLCILASQLQQKSWDITGNDTSLPSIFFEEGACLVVRKMSGSILSASYICPVRISMFRPVVRRRDTANIQHSEVVGTLIEYGCQIFLDSGTA